LRRSIPCSIPPESRATRAILRARKREPFAAAHATAARSLLLPRQRPFAVTGFRAPAVLVPLPVAGFLAPAVFLPLPVADLLAPTVFVPLPVAAS
jgi:hypothetical protein